LFIASYWALKVFEMLTPGQAPDSAANPFAAAPSGLLVGFGGYGSILGGMIIAVCATRLWLRETSLPSVFVRDDGLTMIYFASIGAILVVFICDWLS